MDLFLCYTLQNSTGDSKMKIYIELELGGAE
jgi:hypothetical protein